MRDGEYPVNYLGVERRKRDGKKWTDVNESLLYSFAPCLIDTLDSAFAGHVIEQLDASATTRSTARVFVAGASAGTSAKTTSGTAAIAGRSSCSRPRRRSISAQCPRESSGTRPDARERRLAVPAPLDGRLYRSTPPRNSAERGE